MSTVREGKWLVRLLVLINNNEADLVEIFLCAYVTENENIHGSSRGSAN